jgi:hypothetical protein
LGDVTGVVRSIECLQPVRRKSGVVPVPEFDAISGERGNGDLSDVERGVPQAFRQELKEGGRGHAAWERKS